MSALRETPQRHGIFQNATHSFLHLTKILQQQPLNIQKARLQMLTSIFYPPNLLKRGAARYGWLAALPLHLTTPELRASIDQRIKAIEANSSLEPYDKVAQITQAIKDMTGKKFIADSAFRQMMNAKFNEYVLEQNIEHIHSVQDALKFIERNSVQSKGSTLLGAAPELFALGGAVQSMAKPRKRSSVIASSEADHLQYLNGHVTEFSFGKVMDKTIECAIKCKTILTRFYANRSKYLEHKSDTDKATRAIRDASTDLKALISEVQKIHPEIVSKHALDPNLLDSYASIRSSEVLNKLQTIANLTHDIESAIKSTRVPQLDSNATTLIGCAVTKYEKRQPVVTCVDKILRLDNQCGPEIWRMDAAQVIHAANYSILPNKIDAIEPNAALRDATRGCLENMFGPIDWEQDKNTWLGEGYSGISVSTIVNTPQDIAKAPYESKTALEPQYVGERIRVDEKLLGQKPLQPKGAAFLANKNKLTNALIAMGADQGIIERIDWNNPRMTRWTSNLQEAMECIDALEHHEVWQEMIKNPKAKDADGNPPLHAILKEYASETGAFHIAKELADSGASFEDKGFYGVPMKDCIVTAPSAKNATRHAANMLDLAKVTMAKESISEVFSEVTPSMPKTTNKTNMQPF